MYEKIKRALDSVYGIGHFPTVVNETLANHIVVLLQRKQDAMGNDLTDDEVKEEIFNLIWANWPGGNTAEIATQKIYEALQ